jgi:hypothetical protein
MENKKMKKNNEDNQKTLKWRLSELPTAGDVAELVDSGVITPEEAREILFTEASSSDEKVKALEEQLAFMQDLVKQLAGRNPTTFVQPFSRVVTTPTIYWASTSKSLHDSGLTMTSSSGRSGELTLSVNGSSSGNLVS